MSERYLIPNSMMEAIIAKYRGGVTLITLSNEYNIPYDILRNKLNHHKINVHDFTSENCGKIMAAESKLITGSFPDYKLSSEYDGKRYKSLLFYYAHSDLNSGYVGISNRLLR